MNRPWIAVGLLALLYPVLDKALGVQMLPALCQILIYLMLAQGLNLVVGFAGLLHLGYAAFFVWVCVATLPSVVVAAMLKIPPEFGREAVP